MRTCAGCSHPTTCRVMGCGAAEVQMKKQREVDRLALRRAIWDFQHSSRIGWLESFEAADADPLIHAILDAFAMGELLDQKRRREYSEQRKRAQQQRKPNALRRVIDQKSRAAGEREEPDD